MWIYIKFWDILELRVGAMNRSDYGGRYTFFYAYFSILGFKIIDFSLSKKM